MLADFEKIAENKSVSWPPPWSLEWARFSVLPCNFLWLANIRSWKWSTMRWSAFIPSQNSLSGRIGLFYFWICWVFIAVQGLFLLGVSGGCSLRCTGFSLKWLLLLWSIGSRCTAFSSCKRGPSCCSLWALECGLSICGTGGLVTLRHVESSWIGVKPVSSALAGGFSPTAPPRKSPKKYFFPDFLIS